MDLEKTEFYENQAEYGGGAIYVASSKYEISSSLIQNNESFVGSLFTHRSEGIVSNSSITDNLGSGIAVINSPTTEFQGSVISGNHSSQSGGGIVSDNLDLINLSDQGTSVSGNLPDNLSQSIPTFDFDRHDRYAIAQLERLLDIDTNTYLFDLDLDVNQDLVEISSESISHQDAEDFSVLTKNVDLLTGQIIDSAKIVHEFVNQETGAQLYTLDTAHQDFIANNLEDVFSYEGAAFYAFESPNSGSGADLPLIPVYRLYNPGTESYFYTSDESEVNFISEVSGELSPKIAFYTVDV